MKHLLPSVLAASLLSLLVVACGSGAKSRSEAKTDSAHLLALAIGQAKRMGDANPSLIDLESGNRSASLVVGIRSCGRAATTAPCRLAAPVDYRAGVDLKTGKARAFVPLSPPRVTGWTERARALARRSAVSLGMDRRVRISLVDAWWHRRTPAIAVVFRGGAGTAESDWREELVAIRSSEPPAVPVVSYSNSSTNGDVHSRQPFGGRSPGVRSHLYSLSQKLGLLGKVIETAERDGARITSLALYGSVNPALSVTIETGSPASYLKHDLEAVLKAIQTFRPTLDGSYVHVVDRKGGSILETGGTEHDGFVCVVPALEGCSPIDHSRPSEYVVPPCPVK
jgi:hypothetical protein